MHAVDMKYETPSLRYVSLDMASTILAASSVYAPDAPTPASSIVGPSGIETSTGFVGTENVETQFGW